MERVVFLVLGYFLGLIQMSFIVGKILGVDLSKKGSGNMGATNSLRVLGKKVGAIVFFGDYLKALIPCVLVKIIYKEDDNMYLYITYLGMGVILGHIFPFYLSFKGGKGIASSMGLFTALDFRFAIFCVILFILAVIISRYVSVASILIMLSFFVFSILFNSNVLFISTRYKRGLEFVLLSFLISSITIYKHFDNIKRILKGIENKV